MCPTYVFNLSNTYTFRTSDNLVQHASKGKLHISIAPTILVDVSDIHLDHFKSAHEIIHDQMNEINNLLNQAEEFNKEVNATIIFDKTITWKSAAITGMSSTSILPILLFFIYILYRFKSRMQIPTIIFREKRASNNLRSEVDRKINEINRKIDEKITNMHNINNPIKSQVHPDFYRRTDDFNFNEALGNYLVKTYRPRTKRANSQVSSNISIREEPL